MTEFPHDQMARSQQLMDVHDAHDRRGSASIDNPDPHELRCKRLSDDAILPTRTHDTDAGWDLYSSVTQCIMSARWGLVGTGISMEIPKGYVGLIWPRSGLAVKKGVDVFAGVIDSGYRGEIKVCLFNSSNHSHLGIQKGDRVAQILFQEVPKITMVEVEDLMVEVGLPYESKNSQRGVSGFGSSGR